MPTNGTSCCFCGKEKDSETDLYAACAVFGTSVMKSDDGLITVLRLCDPCHKRYVNGDTYYDCPCCGRSRPEFDLNEIEVEVNDTNIMCNRCVENNTFTCSSCDRLMHTDNQWGTTSDGYICDNCSDDYYRCYECSTVIYCDNVFFDRDGDNPYCEDCYREDSGNIHDYDYTPHPLLFHGSPFKRKDPKTVYFGCELEVEVSGSIDDTALRILGAMGDDRIYIKSDGSISHGFEIVTHPHTFDEMCALWRERWSQVRANNLKSHNTNTCGFHVHVSRRALTKLHVQKIVVFINAAANISLVNSIAQRNSAKWAKILDKKIGHCGHSEDRYEAVNVTESETIEFRIFKGNVRTDRILKNIQFVHATVEFTRDRSYRDLSAEEFGKFVSNNKKKYKELHEYMKGATAQPNQ